MSTDITVSTSQGQAVATPQGAGMWLLSTPWSDRRFAGTTGEAGAELRRMVRDGEAAERKPTDCRNCGGAEFSVEGGPCPACNGTGKEPRKG